MKRNICFVAWLLMGVVMWVGEAGACKTIAPEVMSKGVQFVRERKPQEAIREFNKGLADGYHNRGEAYQIAGRWNEAMADYSKAAILNPNDSRPFYGRAQYYAVQGRFVDALEELNRAIAINDSSSKGYVPMRAWIYGMTGELDFALKDYNRILANIPVQQKKPIYLAQRGFVYYYKGDFEKALADFNAALSLNPGVTFAYFGRSLTYAMLGQQEKAKADLERVRQINDGLARHYWQRSKDLRHYGLKKKADEYIKYAIMIDPSLN